MREKWKWLVAFAAVALMSTLLFPSLFSDLTSTKPWNLPLSGRIIVLDPGHGGPDGGAVGGEAVEKDIALNVAKNAARLSAAARGARPDDARDGSGLGQPVHTRLQPTENGGFARTNGFRQSIECRSFHQHPSQRHPVAALARGADVLLRVVHRKRAAGEIYPSGIAAQFGEHPSTGKND